MTHEYRLARRKLGLNDTPSGLPPMGCLGGLGGGVPTVPTPQAPANAPKVDRPTEIAWIIRTRAALAAPGSDVERALRGLLAPWSPDVAAVLERIADDIKKL